MRQFKAEGLRDDLFAGTPDTFFHEVFVGQSWKLQGFRILVVDISVACMHARTDDEKIFVKSAFRYQELNILATQGSSEWIGESIKALARVLMRQARDKYAFPAERHQSVYLQKVL